MTTPPALIDTPRLAVGFDVRMTPEGLYFRATHTARASWHGPYDGTLLTNVADAIATYVRLDLSDFLKHPQATPAFTAQAIDVPNRDHCIRREPDPDFLAAHEEEANGEHIAKARR